MAYLQIEKIYCHHCCHSDYIHYLLSSISCKDQTFRVSVTQSNYSYLNTRDTDNGKYHRQSTWCGTGMSHLHAYDPAGNLLWKTERWRRGSIPAPSPSLADKSQKK